MHERAERELNAARAELARRLEAMGDNYTVKCVRGSDGLIRTQPLDREGGRRGEQRGEQQQQQQLAEVERRMRAYADRRADEAAAETLKGIREALGPALERMASRID